MSCYKTVCVVCRAWMVSVASDSCALVCRKVVLVNAVVQLFDTVAFAFPLVGVRLNLNRGVIDVELGLQHLRDLKKCKRRRVLGDHVRGQNRLLRGNAPEMEIMHLVHNFQLLKFIC